MALYSLAELYHGLSSPPFAIGAFNVHNMEFTQAVITAAELEEAPVILMIGEAMVPFAGLDMLSAICQFAARNTKIPVAVTLDHGKSLDLVERSIRLGMSIMFDGSQLPFEENIRLTRELAQKAHRANVSIEGELGHVGGSEDGEAVSAALMTDPQLAVRFVEETEVDALAIAIGNCHGLYQSTPQLDLRRLQDIAEIVETPLVLHGGSDLPAEQVRQAINLGIRKFNVGTDLKYTFMRSLKTVLDQEPMPIQPPAVFGAAREAVVNVVREKIRLSGSSGLGANFRG